jgi:hypothetical protein
MRSALRLNEGSQGFRSTCARRGIVVRMARHQKSLRLSVAANVRSLVLNLRSSCAVGIVSLFVLFLVASAPHRVHHFFEKLPFPVAETHSHAHDHPTSDTSQSHGQDHESRQPQQSDCAMQSVAQNSHVSSAQLIEIAFLEISSAQKADHRVVISTSFNPSPFSQRAPPTI